ncbi:hypothetical protein TthAK1_18800 [Thermus thermophilus]|nr:hypothetical protein TthAK1_18800 [Thermus thermophilus]
MEGVEEAQSPRRPPVEGEEAQGEGHRVLGHHRGQEEKPPEGQGQGGKGGDVPALHPQGEEKVAQGVEKVEGVARGVAPHRL